MIISKNDLIKMLLATRDGVDCTGLERPENILGMLKVIYFLVDSLDGL